MRGCNLVLVDEGHRGAKNNKEREVEKGWMARREQLAAGGFTMEYSATFKEAVQGDETTRNVYAKAVLFDYAYRSFYRDGFGKDFSILNLEEDEQQTRYLTAALLMFYQQMQVWKDGGAAMRPFLIDKPLWVFVGHTVVGKASNAEDRDSVSDVVEVLLFLKTFLANPQASRQTIEHLLTEGFVDRSNKNLLAHRLPHIDTHGDKPALARSIHDAILREVFQAPGGGVLCVQLLKNADGELALKVGENEPFGVVNVGDPESVADRCQEQGITVLEVDQNRDSLFHGINHNDSSINLLVGSRKFTEGWNSWRVSSIGLMHMGKNEGTQIIQLFGRGVRLRGYQFCLRRSSVLSQRPPLPANLRQVETLQVFGVKASYMSTFREWIFSELPEAQEKQFWQLPIVQTLPERKLKILDIREEIEGEKVERGQAFRKLGPLVQLRAPHDTAAEDSWLRSHRTKLNWLPRVRGLTGQDRKIGSQIGEATVLPPQRFNAYQLAVLDYHELRFGLEAFKATRGLDRLHADADGLRILLANPNWYALSASAEDMRCDRYENRAVWQRMAQQLVNNYAERFYRFVRGRWEAPYIEVIEVTADHRNMMGERCYQIETTDLAKTVEDVEQIADFVRELSQALAEDNLALWRQWMGNWKTVPFAGHLYQPLMHVGKHQRIKISPVPLDRHEAQFVEDLAKWCKQSKAEEVYLLRNQSVTGLGFFQASNFFPDFLVWQHDGQQQYLAFADPKGLHNPELTDPKLQFPTQEIPRLQAIIAQQDPNLHLSAFIISNTQYADLEKHKGEGEKMTKAELEQLGILFQVDDSTRYIETMMKAMKPAHA